MNYERIARFISRLCEPMLVMGVLTCIGAVKSGLSGPGLLFFMVTVVIVMIAPTFFIRRRWMRQGVISDWDMKVRTQRVRPMLYFFCLLFVYACIVWLFHNTFLIRLFVFYIFYMAGFFLITLRYKISGHLGAITFATLSVVMWYGWDWAPILLFIPLNAWARVVLRNHTTGQVIAGFCYSAVMVYLLGIFLNY